MATTVIDPVNKVIIVHGGELAHDIAQQLSQKKPENLPVHVSIQNASERPKSLLNHGKDTVVCFIIQTIENECPTEEVRAHTRTFSFVVIISRINYVLSSL